ncbi:unnamed protein product [Caenorhabditis bovis]|uniref:Uncharacterized protein n=1 Tax=Caenorhabditis bovis TaxID=2654633 RepID=A0A8S1EZY7_9PELO|nr:unnamed protein product [Caenorhabditis bovis]
MLVDVIRTSNVHIMKMVPWLHNRIRIEHSLMADKTQTLSIPQKSFQPKLVAHSSSPSTELRQLSLIASRRLANPPLA